jgi:hypothetical protein
MMTLLITNDGADVVSTNFWQTHANAAGKFYLSFNAGTARLLVPTQLSDQAIVEMRTAKSVVISRGPWISGRPDALELLFEDGSDSPFSLQLSDGSFDHYPAESDQNKQFTCTVWIDGPIQTLKFPCFYRAVEKLPCLKPI